MTARAIAHFEVEGELGRGAMGVVYRAVDTRLRRTVALKVLPPELVGDERRRARLVREARAAAAVNHPNVATVYEIGEVDDAVYISMEHVDGQTLRELIESDAVPATRELEILLALARALAAAHDTGVIHRDLKPANVMLAASGGVKLLDFGLAKDTAVAELDSIDEQLETREGALVGTPAYMSPEQCRGRPADRRSDVFAFGTLAYELVGGRRPFTGDSATDLGMAIISDPPPPLSGLAPAAPGALVAAIDRCLAKDPDDRYQDFHAVIADLERAGGKRPRPGPSMLLLAGAAVAATAIVAAYRLIPDRATPLAIAKPPPPAVELHERPLTSFSGRAGVSTTALSRDGRRFAYGASQRLWIRELPDGEPRVVELAGSRRATPLDFFPGGDRLLVWIADPPVGVGVVDLSDRRLETLRDGVRFARLSPGGDRLAFYGSRGIAVADLDGAGERLLSSLSASESGYQLAWAPDGTRVAAVTIRETAAGRAPALEIFDAAGAGVTRVPTQPLAPYAGLAWLDDDRLAYVRRGPELCVRRVRPESAGQAPPRCVHRWERGAIDWMHYAAGRLVYVKNLVWRSVEIAELDDSGALGSGLEAPPGQDGDHRSVGWTPDGRLVGWTGPTGAERPMIYRGGHPPAAVAGASGLPVIARGEIAVMRRVDGRCELSAVDDPRPMWSAPERDGRCPVVVCPASGSPRCATVRLGSDFVFRRLDLAAGSEVGDEHRRPAVLNNYFDIAADGSRIAWGIEDGDTPAIAVLDLDSGGYREIRPRGDLKPHDVTWDGERRWIVTGIAERRQVVARVADDGSYAIVHRAETPSSLHNPRPSPDGRLLAIGVTHEQIDAYMLEGL